MKAEKEIIEMYIGGKSVPKISVEIGLGRTSIYKLLSKNNIKRRTGKDYRPKSGGKEKEIIALYQTGLSAADTANELKVCEATVLYVLRRAGIKIRRVGIHNVTKAHNWKNGVSKDVKHQRAVKNLYRAKRKINDPIYKLTHTLRSRIGSAFKRQKLNKSSSSQELLGATWITVFAHLESQFREGMTWENHGYGKNKWHVDHIIPLALAKNQEELIKLFHYTNLQPLWQKENQSKGGRYAS